MNTLLRRLLLLTGLVSMSLTWSVSAYDVEGWKIDRFHTHLYIQEDTDIRVVEEIDVDFYDVERRGILRDIPIYYDDPNGKPFDINLQVKRVDDKRGNSWEYTTYESWPYLVVRVGNPDVYLSGKQSYVIEYTVQRANLINEKDGTIEYFWNATGSWPVDIQDAFLTFHIPDTMDYDIFKQVNCFTGVYESVEQYCMIHRDRGDRTVTIENEYILETYEQMSGAVLLDSTDFQLPGFWQKVIWWLQAYWSLVVLWGLGILIIILWWFYGKEYPMGAVMPVWHAPLDLHPIEVGVLLDDKSHNRDIAATLIFFATQGFMKVKRHSSAKYSFTKLKEPTGLTPAEQYLWDELFKNRKTVSTTQLRYTFYSKITKVHEKMYKHLTDLKLYYQNPDEISTMYSVFGWLILIGGIIWSIIIEDGDVAVWSLLIGVLWILMALIMPKKTRKGIGAYAEVLGMKEYIGRAEKDRLDFHNAPIKTPEEFERLLPFAMVLGVEKQWAKEFKDIYKQNPSWFEGGSDSFNTSRFISQMNSMTRTTSYSMTAVRSSSGGSSGTSSFSSFSSSGGSSFSGGFSGGGFGGGGGGSW